MLFENKKRRTRKYSILSKMMLKYLKTQNKEDISIIMGEDGKYYAFIPDFIT
jgi:hypothetical protein